MGITVNTSIGSISALPHESNRIKSLTDEQLVASVDAAEIADPYEFQEVLNRGLYSRTARYKAYYGESRGCEVGRECADGCECDRTMRRWKAEELS